VKAGWVVKALGEVATFVMGQAPAGSDCNKDGVGIPFVKAGEFGESRPVIREWTTDPKKFAKETDVLICVVGATCGKINLGADCAIGRSAAAIRPNPKALDQFFLHYYLEGQVQTFRAGSLGAAQTVISREMLSEMELPLPPLDEQKRIVEVLDTAFESLTRARAHTEANLENARELFDCLLSETFSPRRHGWEFQRLGDLCDVRDGTHDSPKYVNDGVKFVTQKNIRKNGLDLSDTKQISDEDHKNFWRRSNVATGDILISMIGANRGMSCLVDVEEVFSIKNVGLIKSGNRFDMRFLLHFLKSQTAMDYVEAETNGGAQPFIGLTKLRDFPVFCPDIGLQASVADQLDDQLKTSTDLQSHYRAKLADLDDLRQSLLQKAFAGELT
jgi:type I restriction enzyme S subunit